MTFNLNRDDLHAFAAAVVSQMIELQDTAGEDAFEAAFTKVYDVCEEAERSRDGALDREIAEGMTELVQSGDARQVDLEHVSLTDAGKARAEKMVRDLGVDPDALTPEGWRIFLRGVVAA